MFMGTPWKNELNQKQVKRNGNTILPYVFCYKKGACIPVGPVGHEFCAIVMTSCRAAVIVLSRESS